MLYIRNTYNISAGRFCNNNPYNSCQSDKILYLQVIQNVFAIIITSALLLFLSALKVGPSGIYKKIWIANGSITAITIKDNDHVEVNFIGSVTHFRDVDINLHFQ